MSLRNLATLVVAASCCIVIGGSAAAQTTPPTPDAAPANAAPAAPQAGPDTAQPANSAAPADATSPAAPADTGPVVAYVQHAKPPAMTDMTVASAEFGMIGAIAAISSGQEIIDKNQIQDPTNDMAHAIAAAFAAAHGARVADTPIPDDPSLFRTSAKKLTEQANGARYVVDIDAPAMELIYFPFDWNHRDLMFFTVVKIVDTSTNKVVANARCMVKTKNAPDLMSHDQLLADGAAGLKQLIARKSATCLAELRSRLKL